MRKTWHLKAYDVPWGPPAEAMPLRILSCLLVLTSLALPAVAAAELVPQVRAAAYCYEDPSNTFCVSVFQSGGRTCATTGIDPGFPDDVWYSTTTCAPVACPPAVCAVGVVVGTGALP